MYEVGYWLLATAAVLTLVSMILYIRGALPVILRRDHGNPPGPGGQDA